MTDEELEYQLKKRREQLVREIITTESSILAANRRMYIEQDPLMATPVDDADLDELRDYIGRKRSELDLMLDEAEALGVRI